MKIPNLKYSWAETYETYSVTDVAWAKVLLSSANLLGASRQERVKLPLAESVPVQEISLNVKVGDLVRQIIG